RRLLRLFPYPTLFRSAPAKACPAASARADDGALRYDGVAERGRWRTAGLCTATLVQTSRGRKRDRRVVALARGVVLVGAPAGRADRKSTRLNSGHVKI